MRKTRITVTVLATALTVIVLGFGAPRAQAQRQVQLIDFMTTPWRYEASGADQMVAWRARTFNDASWTPGMGLFGVEVTPNVYLPYTFNTAITPYNDQIITYYFRAHFNMAASDFVWPLTLVTSNLVDDGSVIYLNGAEVGRPGLRVPQNQNYLTPSANQGNEGVVEVVNISTNGLLVGDNVIAVEVHQTGAGSSDIVHGLSLTAIVPTALAITSQPPSQTSMTVAQSVILSVGISGGPALYQWQTNNGAGTFVNVAGATNNSYVFIPSAAGTRIFRLVASNGVNTVISSTATVEVAPDKAGPLMLSAIVLEEVTRTNVIQIAWNERLLPSTVNLQSRTNFSVVLMPNNIVVGISNVIYNPGTFPSTNTPPTVRLTMNTTNWHFGSNYCVVVNNVRDFAATNVIAPNSRICVSWPATTNVMQMSDCWDFFDSYFFDTTIYSQPWMATNFVPDFNNGWGTGCGILYKDPVMQIVNCAGDTLGTQVSIQNQPTLFRRSFLLPPSVTNSILVQLKLRHILDDGAVFFLNGKEFFQTNMGMRTPGTPIVDTTLAGPNVVNPTCRTNELDVPSDVPLFPGTNWLAVAVCQGDPLPQFGAEDIAFGLEMDARLYGPGPIPPNPVPTLTIAQPTPTSVRIAWPTGYGYALESTPILVEPMWMEVQPNMANPMVITNLSTMGGNCFFRLRKVQIQ